MSNLPYFVDLEKTLFIARRAIILGGNLDGGDPHGLPLESSMKRLGIREQDRWRIEEVINEDLPNPGFRIAHWNSGRLTVEEIALQLRLYQIECERANR